MTPIQNINESNNERARDEEKIYALRENLEAVIGLLKKKKEEVVTTRPLELPAESKDFSAVEAHINTTMPNKSYNHHREILSSEFRVSMSPTSLVNSNFGREKELENLRSQV
jgi:hypothetical protein